MSTHICFASEREASPSLDPVDERVSPQCRFASFVMVHAFGPALA
jgi:hypothetical protein